LSRDCQQRNPHGPPNSSNTSSASQMARHGSKKVGISNVYVKLKLAGKEVSCLVDSGCDITLVPKDLIKLFRSMEVKPTTQQIWAANNTPISVEGEVQLPFFLDEECLWTTALISEDIEEVMLGIDWLQRYECIWDFKTGDLCINGHPAVTLTRHGHTKCQRVLAPRHVGGGSHNIMIGLFLLEK